MSTGSVAVLTTIQTPTTSALELARRLAATRIPLIVIGDKIGPADFDCPGSDFYSLSRQMKLPFKLARLLPTGHYSRKNLGYLLAISGSAGCIYETDDDNSPLDDWRPQSLRTAAVNVRCEPWCNVYSFFTDALIWPRGLPLDRIHGTSRSAAAGESASCDSPIQQGLANGSPDVDAIWRLVCEQDLTFNPGPSVRLLPGTWCPFNSQSTWWWPQAYPLLYLPSFCSFRMTDIWRSLIAQRCLWELGFGVVFHGAQVRQDRNVHRLMKDFEDEIPGYRLNTQIAELLSELTLDNASDAVGANLRRCYAHLVQHAILPPEEMPLVEAWLSDLAAV